MIKSVALLVCLFLIGVGNLSQIHGQIYVNTHYKQVNIIFSETDYKYFDLAPDYYQSTLSKLLEGTASSLSYNVVCGIALYFAPTDFTHWADNLNVAKNWKTSFTSSPIWDEDAWYTNYLGHTYQGAFYYNSVRSQGVSMAGSALFATFQTLLWEFVLEGAYEQPSKNDLLITPILGSVAGELINQLTIRFRRNGFTLVEKIIVILFNPNYAIQKGFKAI